MSVSDYAKIAIKSKLILKLCTDYDHVDFLLAENDVIATMDNVLFKKKFKGLTHLEV